MANPEGPVSPLVTDAKKILCPVCNGSFHQSSLLGDEPEDIENAATWWATIAVENATKRTANIALCHCGREMIVDVLMFDTYTFTGAEKTPVGTNLDATTADGLAGWWFVVLLGTDAGKYVAISSNTVATPRALTLAYNVADDADGLCMIKFVEPVGLTKIVA